MKKDWEKELEEISGLGFDWFISPEHYKKAKVFISNLLAQEKENWVEELEARQIKE